MCCARIEPNFRKFLATEVKRVRELLFDKQVEVHFVKCIAFFFGLRFFDLEDTGASKTVYNIAVETSDELEFDDKSVLSVLPCPFDRFPLACPDFLVAFKNNQLKQSNAALESLQKEVEEKKTDLLHKTVHEKELKGKVNGLQTEVVEFGHKLRLLASELDQKANELSAEKRRTLALKQVWNETFLLLLLLLLFCFMPFSDCCSSLLLSIIFGG